MKLVKITFCSLMLVGSPLNAAVTLIFSEKSEGVSLSYTGQLLTNGLQFQGGLAYNGRFLDINGSQIIEFQNAQPLPIGQHPSFQGTSFRYSADNITFNLQLDLVNLPALASSASGDTFGFYIFERSGQFITWMNLPWQYVSGSPIQGELKFAGESFESMGLEQGEQFRMVLPGGESVAIQVVPEPSTLMLFAAAVTITASRRTTFVSFGEAPKLTVVERVRGERL